MFINGFYIKWSICVPIYMKIHGFIDTIARLGGACVLKVCLFPPWGTLLFGREFEKDFLYSSNILSFWRVPWHYSIIGLLAKSETCASVGGLLDRFFTHLASVVVWDWCGCCWWCYSGFFFVVALALGVVMLVSEPVESSHLSFSYTPMPCLPSPWNEGLALFKGILILYTY